MQRWLIIIALLAVASSTAAAQDSEKEKRRKHRADPGISREHRLPCNGEVSLYYGERLIWKKASDEIRRIEDLTIVPDTIGATPKTALSFRWLLASMPNVAAIELESCQPRLRRFKREMIESDEGAGLYLVATNYRGFRLHRVGKKGRGQGMKNIGRIRLVPADSGDKKMTPHSAAGKGSKTQN